jgi:hypothetical protein
MAGAATGASSATTTPGEMLRQAMLQSTLAGFRAGPANGPLDAASYVAYAPDPAQAEEQFQQEASQPGFAAEIRTWQDATGLNTVLDLAFHFQDPARAEATASSYEALLSNGSPGSGTFSVPGVPDARGYDISVTAASSTVVTNRLEIVVLHVGAFVALVETNVVADPADTSPITSGTVVPLAGDQYRLLLTAAATDPDSQGSNWQGTLAIVVFILIAGAALTLLLLALARVVAERRGRPIPFAFPWERPHRAPAPGPIGWEPGAIVPGAVPGAAAPPWPTASGHPGNGNGNRNGPALVPPPAGATSPNPSGAGPGQEHPDGQTLPIGPQPAPERALPVGSSALSAPEPGNWLVMEGGSSAAENASAQPPRDTEAGVP